MQDFQAESSWKEKAKLPVRHEGRKRTILREEVTNHTTEHRLQ